MIKRIINYIKWAKKYRGTGILTKNIGDDVSFGSNVNIAKDSQIWGGYVGDYSYIMGHTCIAHANIGKFCSIGEHCSIGGWMHFYHRICDSPRLYREILNQTYDDSNNQVVLENDVWVGDNAVIIKGTLGTGSIIGAGAVVTQDIPPYAIAVGNPCHIIGYRFDEATINDLLKSKWWDWDTDKIKRNVEFFTNGGKIIV